jgi:2-polyprenyl-6-methoxyphenol hydroxylase-like FAD-dependent oxidoreductase
MKAIIIGAGIGGLTTAVALEQQGIETGVYETSPALQVAGAGIWMATNAMQVFDRLGLATEVLKEGMPLERVEITDRKLRVIQQSPQDVYQARYGYAITSILRSRLSEILLKSYAKPVHFGKRFQRLEETEEQVQVWFEDGSTAAGDLLIGADGIFSKVREYIAPDAQLRYSGQTCWRGIADISLQTPYTKACVEAWGPDCRLGFSVISGTEVYWFLVAKAPLGEEDPPRGLKKKLQQMVADFREPVPAILTATPEARIIRNDISDLKRLPRWHRDRVCLIGDAAHATTPNMGQGGGQAVEDAWILSRLLSTESDLSRALTLFEAKRRSKVDQVVNTSWLIGKMAHIPFGQGLRNFFMRKLPASSSEKMMQELYNIDY